MLEILLMKSITLRTLNDGNYGIFLVMGSCRIISSTVGPTCGSVHKSLRPPPYQSRTTECAASSSSAQSSWQASFRVQGLGVFTASDSEDSPRGRTANCSEKSPKPATLHRTSGPQIPQPLNPNVGPSSSE